MIAGMAMPATSPIVSHLKTAGLAYAKPSPCQPAQRARRPVQCARPRGEDRRDLPARFGIGNGGAAHALPRA
jgi:hypothetical protein